MSREVVPGAQPCTMDVSSGSPCARLVRAAGLHKATAQGSAQGFTQAPGLNASGPTMNTNAQCYGDIIADSYRHQRSNRSTQPHTRPCTSAHKHPHKQRVNGRMQIEPQIADVNTRRRRSHAAGVFNYYCHYNYNYNNYY